jgi:uracil-DNA glycosylase
MAHKFCPGYSGTWKTLAGDYPDATVFPAAAFRVEWGPIFHRGRLDGTARICVIGQDPAQSENIARRILVGQAGLRVQGFLAKLGIDRRYVMVNALLYSAYDQQQAQALVTDAAVTAYRNRWLDALLIGKKATAVVALGGMADTAYAAWTAERPTDAANLTYVKVMHPTADSHPPTTTAQLLASWNAGLTALAGKVKPDKTRALVPYGAAFAAGELVEIPEADLPCGIPAWMRGVSAWAERPDDPDAGASAAAKARYKRARILVSAPDSAIP